MASDLDSRDEARLRTLWHAIAERPDRFDIPALLSEVAGLVPSDYSSYSEIDELHGRASSHYLPGEAVGRADYQAFQWLVHQHPMLRLVRVSGHGGPWRLSDVVTQRQWHDLGLYHEFFRPMRVDYQVAFTAGDPRAPAAAALAFNRAGRDFDDRDLAVLRAALPMFRLLHRLTTERRRTAAAQLALDQRSAKGVVVLGPAGHLEWLDRLAEEAVRLVPHLQLTPGGLPAPALLDWLAGPAASLRLSTGGDTVVVVERGPDIDDRRTLLLEMWHDVSADALTSREHEILTLVADGLSNRQVAHRLSISPRTVEKHLEHAYSKLGVHTRLAATRGASRTRSR